MSSLSAESFHVWRQYIHRVSGIDLEASKSYFIEGRLAPIARAEGCASLEELYYRALGEKGGQIRRKVIDAITVRETSFFRDENPFALLQNKLLPELIDRRRRSGGDGPIPIRIWSAACSTGQETYSIAMTVRQLLGDAEGYRLYILGTDISDQALAKASYGAFSKFDTERGLSTVQRERFFRSEGEMWRVRDELRAMVAFKRMNLMDDWGGLGSFDIIFLRNVAIYFRNEDRVSLFKRVAGAMERNGALIVGAMESVSTYSDDFESRRYHRTVYYALREEKRERRAGLASGTESASDLPGHFGGRPTQRVKER